MADEKDSNLDNVAGLYFVDSQCIACDACVEEAPAHFAMNDIDGHAYVFFQPGKPAELEICQSALDLCPVNAIGKKSGEAKN